MLTADYLKTILQYNETTGIFTWLKSTTNKVKAGNIAGYKRKDGYSLIRINSKLYLTHRLAWLYMYGEFPQGQIDHINGNTLNNSIINLRDVTNRENQQNQKSHRKGKLLGANYHKRYKKWVAQIKINGKNKHIGNYNTELEAHEAHISALWLITEVGKL